jgi:CubicO group peptidase (beta-lactamase class C family)
VPGLSVAVVKGDRLVWARGFGFADLTAQTPATPRTLYLWFSMTKIATATAVLRLAEGGNLDLDAPVTDHIPTPTPGLQRNLVSSPRSDGSLWST